MLLSPYVVEEEVQECVQKILKIVLVLNVVRSAAGMSIAELADYQRDAFAQAGD